MTGAPIGAPESVAGAGKPRLAVVGGTGALGSGLARRFAGHGFDVAIGSRDPARANAEGNSVGAVPNLAAAEAADIVFLCVPFASQEETIRQIAPGLGGKILVDTTVPLVPPKVSVVQLPEGGSAAIRAQQAAGPDVRVVSALHNVGARHLADDHGSIDCDVLVFGDDPAARDAVIALLEAIGLPAVHGGVLANSAAAEALTSVLIFLNRRHKTDRAGIRLTGLGAP